MKYLQMILGKAYGYGSPSFARTRYFSIEKTINIIHKASDAQHIAIICENPQMYLN